MYGSTSGIPTPVWITSFSCLSVSLSLSLSLSLSFSLSTPPPPPPSVTVHLSDGLHSCNLSALPWFPHIFVLFSFILSLSLLFFVFSFFLLFFLSCSLPINERLCLCWAAWWEWQRLATTRTGRQPRLRGQGGRECRSRANVQGQSNPLLCMRKGMETAPAHQRRVKSAF